jgi:hypothetical protein
MKKTYFAPDMEWIRFKTGDVIATSTPIGEGDDDLDSVVGGEENGDF